VLGDGLRLRPPRRRSALPDPDGRRPVLSALSRRAGRDLDPRCNGGPLPRRARGDEWWLSGDDLRRQRPRVHLECARPVGDGAWREARVQPSRQAGRQCIRRELQRTAARRVPQRELVPLADRGQNFDPAMGEGLQRRKTALGTWRTYTHRVRTIANSDITSGVEEGGT